MKTLKELYPEMSPSDRKRLGNKLALNGIKKIGEKVIECEKEFEYYVNQYAEMDWVTIEKIKNTRPKRKRITKKHVTKINYG